MVLGNVQTELLNDFIELAAEAKSRSAGTGLTGQLTGLFAGAKNTDVQDAAEAAQQALRALTNAADFQTSCQHATVIADAAVLASARPRALAGSALLILQKMFFNGLLSTESTTKVVNAMAHVASSKPHDEESIKLKLLQTCLTFLQLKRCVYLHEETRMVLGICFRILGTRQPSTITTTASAIVRQAIALLFEHVSAPWDSSHGDPPPGHMPSTPSTNPSRVLQFESPGDRAGPETPTSSMTVATMPPPDVAIMLLQQLCVLGHGNASELLECPGLSRVFVLDTVGDLLRGHTHDFRKRPELLAVLREDVAGMLHAVLRCQLEADTEAVQVAVLRVAVQTTATLLTLYGHLIPARTELLLVALMDGINSATHIAQQVLCMNALRNICLSAPILHFLHTTFDVKMEYSVRAVKSILQTAAEFVLSFVASCRQQDGGMDTDSISLLASLWSQTMNNRNSTFESELASHASTGHGGIYIVILGLDTVAALVHSVVAVVDRLELPMTPGTALPPRAPVSVIAHTDSAEVAGTPTADGAQPAATGTAPGGAEAPEGDGMDDTSQQLAQMALGSSGPVMQEPRISPAAAALLLQEHIWGCLGEVSEENARALVELVAPPALEVLTELLRIVAGEAILVHSLRALQAMATVAGVLGLRQVTLSFVHAVVSFTADASAPPATPPPPATSKRSSEGMLGPSPRTASARSALTASGSLQLGTPRGPGAASPKGSAGLQPASSTSVPDRADAQAAAPRAPLRRELMVLSPKNFQAYRTLFNITQALFERMDSAAWTATLTALATLDEFLGAPGSVTLSGPAAAGADRHADVSVLTIAVEQVFAATADASNAALETVMLALADLSERRGVSLKDSTPRDVALQRMADVVVCNTQRLALAWGPFFGRVQAMAAATDPATRSAVLAVYLPTTSGLLTRALQDADLAGGGTDGDSGHQAPEARSPRAAELGCPPPETEELLCTSLLQVFTAPASQSDVRFGCLGLVREVLQVHGERLSAAWASVLGMLDQSATRPGERAQVVRLAHECMELVVSDYLHLLPEPLLRATLNVEAAFVTQAVDMNTAYAATLGLWRAGDIIGHAVQRHAELERGSDGPATPTEDDAAAGKASVAADGAVSSIFGAATQLFTSFTSGLQLASAPSEERLLEPEAGSRPGASTKGSEHGGLSDAAMAQLASKLGLADCRELLLFVMEIAQRLALEPRPEVRTSGIKLLFDTMTRYAAVLEGSEGRIWDMAFPLLMEVVKNVQLSEEAHCVTTGTTATAIQEEHGDLRHHSRDSFTKQWLETLDKALRGAAAYLRVTLTNVVHLRSFEQDWPTMMAELVGLVTMAKLPEDVGSRKVSLAAMAFWPAVVAPYVASQKDARWLWRVAWGAIVDSSGSLAAPGTGAHASIRQKFLQAVAATYTQARHQLEGRMYEELMAMLTAFASRPVSERESWPSACYLPPVQATVLAVMPQLMPPPSHDGWAHVISFLCSQLAPADAAQAPEADTDVPAVASDGGWEVAAAGSSPAGTGGAGMPRGLVWMQEISALMVRLVKQHMPWAVRAQAFWPLVTALRPGLARFWNVAAAAPGVRTLVQDFCALVNMGLPAVRAEAVHSGTVASGSQAGWDALYCIFRDALLHSSVAQPPVAADKCTEEGSAAAAAAVAMAVGAAAATGNASEAPADETPAGGSKAASQAGEAGEGAVAAAAAAAAWEPELATTVLDCLTDTVLVSSTHTPRSVQQQLVRLVDDGCRMGAAAAATCPGCPQQLLAHLCLRKMCGLCGRGASVHPESQESHLDVSKIALPLFLVRCDNILATYLAVADAPRTPTSVHDDGSASAPDCTSPPATLSPRPKPPQLPADLVLCVLHALSTLHLAPAVVDDPACGLGGSMGAAATGDVTDLVAFIRWHRAEAREAGSSPKVDSTATPHQPTASLREQTHLLILFNRFCECARVGEQQVREAALQALERIGVMLRIPPSANVAC